MYVSEQDFNCNAPCEILEGLRNCGFDVLTNANNHDLDTGVIGLAETIENIERFGFIQTGTFKEKKKRFEMIEVNDIKVAIVAFGTDHNGKGVNVTPRFWNAAAGRFWKPSTTRLARKALIWSSAASTGARKTIPHLINLSTSTPRSWQTSDTIAPSALTPTCFSLTMWWKVKTETRCLRSIAWATSYRIITIMLNPEPS